MRKAQLNPASGICCLVYVDRLEAASEEGVMLHARSWRPIILASMLLASKMWHDISYWNSDFSTICPMFTVNGVNALEKMLLSLLQYKSVISRETYTHYYFALRHSSFSQQHTQQHTQHAATEEPPPASPAQPSPARGPADNFRAKLMVRVGVRPPVGVAANVLRTRSKTVAPNVMSAAMRRMESDTVDDPDESSYSDLSAGICSPEPVTHSHVPSGA
jgi:hypothetical protein